MPPVTRIGDNCTGHDACPPRPAISGEASVTVSGSPVVRVGDAYAVHGCIVHPGHSGALTAGAPHISVSGALLGRIGDSVSCGGAAAQGEPTVTAGNMGGSGSGGGGSDSGGGGGENDEDAKRKETFKQMTDAKDRLILGLSEIAEAEPDGLQAAVANVTIFALPAGRTEVDAHGNKRVIVERVYLFTHDGFDFEGDQWLGGWVNTEENKGFDTTMIWLWNEDFRTFRERTGYGNDFRIMTAPELAWEGDFAYDVN